ncbi:hypothetical protein UA08_06910 [Talaromyces atroroseus]|uniref:Uncharacterized protein n=1 Tax=Talaromyces atroroseus TaxID=1441469 RepID=A0A225AB79_TALAT|nr:hypothetical protein UA08_06910 [Talaromyces atroroseus]OKL57520.1 hypothetical protein UA08_06910 [Talaromyces atroroseus]
MAVVKTESTSTAKPTAEAANCLDSEATLVVDQGEEDMEIFEAVDEDSAGPMEAKNLQNEDDQRLYAIGGGGYNALKTFQGQVYSGMAIGGSHTWNYDQGLWKETKVEPDRWEIDYSTKKRRARKAPKGSGVPVGAQYHWLIVGHQYVEKLDENTYKTHLVGSKYKLAHKSASATSWSVPTVKGQRDREVDLLEDAKRRVQGLPPVLPTEKAKVDQKQEKGQQTLDTLFTKRKSGKEDDKGEGTKRQKIETQE